MATYNDVLVPGMAQGSPTQATTEQNGDAFGLMPSPVNAFMFGAMDPRVKHDKGLRSGGAFGYSTLFTGAGPESTIGRRLSAGRAALGAVKYTAMGVRNMTGVSPSSGAGRVFEALTRLPDEGLAGAYANWALSGEGLDVASGTLERRAPDAASGVARSAAQTADDRLLAAAREKLADDGVFKALGGVAGGIDLSDTDEALEVASGTGRIRLSGKAVSEQAGHYILGGKGASAAAQRAGSFIGKGIKTLGYLEGFKMAADVAVAGAGQAYSALSRVTQEMQRRNNPDTMSAGYFNRAASTERARAVQELNSSVLNPRQQLMGNEARFMHQG